MEIVTQKILSGWKITNPEILGVPSPKGINSSGNDMLVAEYRLQKTVIDQLQLFIEKTINYLASFNSIHEPITLNEYMNNEKFVDVMNLLNNVKQLPVESDKSQQIKNVN
jgi:hypothetical protein